MGLQHLFGCCNIQQAKDRPLSHAIQLFCRRKTGAFRPKDVCQKQLLTGAKGYRLRDTDERINRLTEDAPQPKKSDTAEQAKSTSGRGNKDIGPPLNHMGTTAPSLFSRVDQLDLIIVIVTPAAVFTICDSDPDMMKCLAVVDEPM